MNLLQEKEINGKTVHYGFSMGAYALMELATKIEMNKIVLVSPSPLFKDIVGKLTTKEVGQINIVLIDKTLSEMCSMIDCEVEVYVGDLEDDFMKETAKKIADEFGVQLNIMKGMGHDKKLFEKVLSIK